MLDLDKKQIKEQKKAEKQADKAQKLEARKTKEAADKEMAGREIASELLSMGEVKIFQNGYVIVGWNFGSPVYEKLLSFEVFSGNLTKKSGLGRGAGAVLTLGLNLWSPNTRGNLIVTIVTDKTTHTGELLPQVNVIKSVNKLQAAANSVLNTGAKASSNPGAAVDNLSSSLEKLVALRDSGALSQGEFEKAKGKLLE